MDALHSSPGLRPTVLVAGGGIAAAEALLALHALAGDRITLRAVTTGRALSYKPLAVTEAFGGGPAPVFDLRRLCAACEAEFVAGALASVDPVGRHAILDDGRALSYDALVVTVGARPEAWLDDAITVYGPGYTARLAGLLFALENGTVESVAFVVPPAAGWTLPAYELALLTARRIPAGVRRPRLTLVTPEPEPLALFGGEVSQAVSALLDEAGVEVVTGHLVSGAHAGRLRLVPARDPLEAERIVTLPALRGPALPGLPHDADGFIPVDEHGRVRGETEVYAAGDVTAGALRQGGIAAQQADAVAAAIAARAGAPVEPEPFRPVLRGILLTGDAPRHLRAEIAGGHGDDVEISEHALWWPPSKIAARHLGPYLAAEEHEALRAIVPPGALRVETVPRPD